jgi:hypothetical protein
MKSAVRVTCVAIALAFTATFIDASCAAAQTLSPDAVTPPTPPRDVSAAAPAARTVVIRGRVIRADTKEPLGGVRIDRSSQDPNQVTGANGQFELAVPIDATDRRATIVITLSKGGYVPQRKTVDAQGIQAASIEVALVKGGVISGRVVDDRGLPIAGAPVALARTRWYAGVPIVARDDNAPSDATDDLGQFRLFAIPAGTYVLAVQTRNPAGSGEVATLYPGVSAPDAAEPVLVRAGAETSGLVIVVPQPKTASITGVVRKTDGQPMTAAEVRAYSTTGGNGVSTGGAARIRPDGSYELASLPSGEYDLIVNDGYRADSQFARRRVLLDGADINVNLTLGKGGTLRGRFVFDGGSPAPGLSPPPSTTDGPAASRNFFLSAEPQSNSASGVVTTNADWTFRVSGLGGRYQFGTAAPAGWRIKAIRRASVDITDTSIDFGGTGEVDGVEFVLTQQSMRVSGAVVDAKGEKVARAIVVLFPADESKLGPNSKFVVPTLTTAGGTFSMTAMRPAAYLAVAVRELGTGEETNPALLRQWRQIARPVSLDWGDAKTLDLKVLETGALPEP